MPDACPEVRPGHDRVPLEHRDRFPAHQLLSDELRDARLGQPSDGLAEAVKDVGDGAAEGGFDMDGVDALIAERRGQLGQL